MCHVKQRVWLLRVWSCDGHAIGSLVTEFFWQATSTDLSVFCWAVRSACRIDPRKGMVQFGRNPSTTDIQNLRFIDSNLLYYINEETRYYVSVSLINLRHRSKKKTRKKIRIYQPTFHPHPPRRWNTDTWQKKWSGNFKIHPNRNKCNWYRWPVQT